MLKLENDFNEKNASTRIALIHRQFLHSPSSAVIKELWCAMGRRLDICVLFLIHWSLIEKNPFVDLDSSAVRIVRLEPTVSMRTEFTVLVPGPILHAASRNCCTLVQNGSILWFPNFAVYWIAQTRILLDMEFFARYICWNKSNGFADGVLSSEASLTRIYVVALPQRLRKEE